VHNILGINAFHGDSSACLVINGRLVAAAEEERFQRVKHCAGVPIGAIRYCLEEAGIDFGDVDVIAINQDSRKNLLKKIGFTLSTRPSLKFIAEKVRKRSKKASIADILSSEFPASHFTGKVHAVEHHLAHLSSAFHVSPFEKSVVVSVDGFGDFASGAWGMGQGVDIQIDKRIYFPDSLGNFYQAMTQYLGFPHYGDEYKVMGLAPYGKPVYLNEMRQIVGLAADGGYTLNLDFFIHHKGNAVYEWDKGVPVFGKIYSDRLVDLLGPERQQGNLEQRHFDIASSIQAMYEEAFFHLLNTLHKKYDSDNLALSGGCAMNSVANGKVKRNTPFKNVYIQSAAGDAGGAIGAAFVAWFRDNPAAKRDFAMAHAYWGPSYSDKEIEVLLEARKPDLMDAGCTAKYIEDDAVLADKTASHIAKGAVIGWFQGRMEWGPRALGNRSILGDPRRADMKDILNLKIKRRESFRPFAPSVLRKSVSDWFEEDDEVPFMMKVFQIKEEKREEIPAVTHVDGSGRLQTVYKETNPKYYQLIESFEKLTGVPMLLNTSFNENEPVVCKPEEALECFLRTSMDVLVLGNWIIVRSAIDETEKQMVTSS
jgi:carbamoyltransferase